MRKTFFGVLPVREDKTWLEVIVTLVEVLHPHKRGTFYQIPVESGIEGSFVVGGDGFYTSRHFAGVFESRKEALSFQAKLFEREAQRRKEQAERNYRRALEEVETLLEYQKICLLEEEKEN